MMKKVLVCWEDRYHEKLDLCLRRALHALDAVAPPTALLYFDDVRGNGGFEPYVRRDWPKIATRGILKSRGSIDYLLCIADADRASTCCDIERPPAPPAATTEWLQRANEAWTKKLRSATTHVPERIFGRFLRWSQESLLLAGHDCEAALLRLGCRDNEALRRHLSSCQPNPLTLADSDFLDHYRHPESCLSEMLAAGRGAATKKGDINRDDALDELSRVSLQHLCSRVPDLLGLATFLRDLPDAA